MRTAAHATLCIANMALIGARKQLCFKLRATSMPPVQFRNALGKFLIGYWNQMALDLYADFRAALDDFRCTEGEDCFKALVADLCQSAREGRFPPLSQISSAYRDPFWSGFGMIVSREDILSCGDLIDLDR